MKIKMLVSLAGEDFALRPGDIAERPDDEAIRLIQREYAVPFVEGPEKAVRKPRETRQGRRAR